MAALKARQELISVPVTSLFCISESRSLYVYAPPKKQKMKDIFYEQLKTAYWNLPVYDIKREIGVFDVKLEMEHIYGGFYMQT